MTEQKVYELTVDPEFRDLIPPLNEEELKLLEASLVADGCESPLKDSNLFLWKVILALMFSSISRVLSGVMPMAISVPLLRMEPILASNVL